MKTHGEIKKALECCSKAEDFLDCMELDCPYVIRDEHNCMNRMAADALSYIQQLESQVADLGKKVPRWIDVDARLPEKGEPVVALRRYEFAPDKYYLQFERYDPRSNMWQDGSVRHWLKLPEPPKEEHYD